MKSKQQQIVSIRGSDDIAGIRAACRLGRVVLDACVNAVRPGITTDELDRIAHEV
jgi:methionyl aminopeptidase